MTESETLILYARRLLSEPHPELEGVWPRAVAFLTRQALESSIGDVLARRAAGAEHCSARAQLLCLPTFAPDGAAHRAAFLWGALSRACHHHPYDLAPTTEELADWLAGVEEVSIRMNPAA